ncbi:MAG: hypothetical protein WC842_03455, partial [Candidatus Paceibacterota bacterium]
TDGTKPQIYPTYPTDGTKPTVSTDGIKPQIYPTYPTDGTKPTELTLPNCLYGYIASDNGEKCLKIDTYSITSITSMGTQTLPTASEAGAQTTIKPLNGECPDRYVTSDNGEKCLKQSIPTLFVESTVAAPTVTFTSGKISVRDVTTKEEVNLAQTEGFKIVVDSKVPVEVQKETDNSISISRNEISASVVDGEKVQVENGIVTVSGNEMKIMPDVAVGVANNESKTKALNVKLSTEQSNSGESTLMYKVGATQKLKIMGLFNVTMPITTSVNAQTATVERVQKPWWSFLAF